MADLPSADEIKGLISLLAPGLIILGIRARVVGGPVPELKDRIVGYALVSAAYYAVAEPLMHLKHGFPIGHETAALVEYFAVPILIGVAYAYTTQFGWIYSVAASIRLHLVHHIPTAWDYTFGRVVRGTFVLITLKDGSVVAGLIGARSFASSSKDERDLLLEEAWTFEDGGEWKRVEPPRSVLICGSEISHVEMMKGVDDGQAA